ncbi:DUF6233 domain-containing protein [Streptomyces sp. SD11]|uniref:DUF6233 domain-containing protein n=1 Tax=Streptomyces sp. SD11 TaxID=3452209 RepID=UPI003F8AB019
MGCRTRHRVGRPPVDVHAGDCSAIGKRRKPISRDEARRRLLDAALRARSHCTPDATLDIPFSNRPGRCRRGTLTSLPPCTACHAAPLCPATSPPRTGHSR